jgi:hypothetical protein
MTRQATWTPRRSRPALTYWRATLACLPASVLLAVVATASVVDTTDTERAMLDAIGLAVIPALIAGLVLWFVARRGRRSRRGDWTTVKAVVVGSLIVLVLQFLFLAGQMTN